MELYPLKFSPIFKDRIWGGNKLKNVFNKDFPDGNIGESWEISDVEEDISVVSEGDLEGKSLRQLVEKYKGLLVGEKVYNKFKNEFPILIKFIDAEKPLSIQVHPNNELAKVRHNSFGKNEMWYIMDCDEDANLIVGFNKELSQGEYKKALADGKVLEILNSEKIKSGDTFYIPTGRVHAIGAGTVLAEIQQTSDVTYRIYDYERIDATTGEQRELHTDLAIDAIDYKIYDNYLKDYELKENSASKLMHSPYFKTDIIQLNGVLKKDYTKLDSFVIYICVEGTFDIEWEDQLIHMNKGETILLPATVSRTALISNKARILEVYL